MKLKFYFLLLICSIAFVSCEKKGPFDRKPKEVEDEKPNEVEKQAFSFVTTDEFRKGFVFVRLTVNGQSVTINNVTERSSTACKLLKPSNLKISGSQDILIDIAYQNRELTLDEVMNGGVKATYNKTYKLTSSQIGEGCNLIYFDRDFRFNLNVGIVR